MDIRRVKHQRMVDRQDRPSAVIGRLSQLRKIIRRRHTSCVSFTNVRSISVVTCSTYCAVVQP